MSSARGLADGPAVGFFGLLAALTAAPLVLLPAIQHVVPFNPGTQAAHELMLFLGANGHVAATLFFYMDPRMRQYMLDGRRGRFIVAPVLLVLGTALVFTFLQGASRAWCIIAYWVWQTHHYTRQNHGILAFVSRAAGVAATTWERAALTLTGVAGVIAMLTFVTPYEETALRPYAWHIHLTGLGVYACGWFAYLASFATAGWTMRSLRAWVVALLMLFYLPLFLFEDLVSAVLSYVVAHGLQYLLFMYVVAGVPRTLARRRVAGVVACTVLGGLAIDFVQRSNYWGAYRGAFFGASLGVVMWHFVVDADLWRLSGSFQRAYMSERFGFLGVPRAVPAEPLPVPRGAVASD